MILKNKLKQLYKRKFKNKSKQLQRLNNIKYKNDYFYKITHDIDFACKVLSFIEYESDKDLINSGAFKNKNDIKHFYKELEDINQIKSIKGEITKNE